MEVFPIIFKPDVFRQKICNLELYQTSIVTIVVVDTTMKMAKLLKLVEERRNQFGLLSLISPQ